MLGSILVIAVIVLLMAVPVVWGYRREMSRPAEQLGSGDEESLDRFNIQVVGESHYQQHFARLCGDRTTKGVDVIMRADVVPDSTNQFDHQAVRVDIRGLTVGYLPREAAPEWRRQFGNSPVQVDALIRGGWYRSSEDEGMFGIRLCRPGGS